MSQLIAYLTTHHTAYLATWHNAHALYHTMTTYCAMHHQLAAYAQRAHHGLVVIYCYTKGQ